MRQCVRETEREREFVCAKVREREKEKGDSVYKNEREVMKTDR